jgi:hypothetical protein
MGNDEEIEKGNDLSLFVRGKHSIFLDDEGISDGDEGQRSVHATNNAMDLKTQSILQSEVEIEAASTNVGDCV